MRRRKFLSARRSGLSPRKVWVVPSSVLIRQGSGERNIRLKLIGMIHGDEGVVPIGRRTKKIVEREIAGEAGVLFQEFGGFKYRGRHRQEIDNSSVSPILLGKFFSQSRPPFFIRFFLPHLLSGWLHYAAEMVFPVSIINASPRPFFRSDPHYQRILRALSRSVRDDSHLSERDIESGLRLLMTGRSLLMAGDIVRRLREDPLIRDVKTASVVVGGGHLEEVRKFLKNPALSSRYCRLILRKLRDFSRNPSSEEIINHSDLDEIIREFEKAEKAFNR